MRMDMELKEGNGKITGLWFKISTCNTFLILKNKHYIQITHIIFSLAPCLPSPKRCMTQILRSHISELSPFLAPLASAVLPLGDASRSRSRRRRCRYSARLPAAIRRCRLLGGASRATVKLPSSHRWSCIQRLGAAGEIAVPIPRFTGSSSQRLTAGLLGGFRSWAGGQPECQSLDVSF